MPTLNPKPSSENNMPTINNDNNDDWFLYSEFIQQLMLVRSTQTAQ